MRKRGRADRKKRKEKGEWAFPGGPGSNVEFLGLTLMIQKKFATRFSIYFYRARYNTC